MSIGLVLTSMRPDKLQLVIEDLCKQTVPVDKVFIIDNGCNIDYFDIKLMLKGFRLICYGKNIGTNQAWNHLWNLDTDYVGLVADDLRLSPYMLETMTKALDQNFCDYPTGIVTASITQKMKLLQEKPNHIEGVRIRSKGTCGAILMKRCTANCIPRIPKEFFIFFGDNYFGLWMSYLDLAFIKINAWIYHIPGPDDVSMKMDYKSVLKRERKYWKAYIRGKASFSP